MWREIINYKAASCLHDTKYEVRFVTKFQSRDSHPSCSQVGGASPEPGMVFANWNAFAEFYERYLKLTNSPVFVILDSVTILNYNKRVKNPLPLHLGYRGVTFGCAHYGLYNSKSEGTRPLQRTCKTGCPAKLRVCYNSFKQGFEIKSVDNKHSDHPLDDHTFKMYSANQNIRALDYLIPRVVVDEHSNVFISRVQPEVAAVKSQVLKFLTYDTPIPKVKQFLRNEHDAHVNTKGLNNIKHKINGSGDGKGSSNEKFVSNLIDDASTDPGMKVETISVNNSVEVIYFQYSWMANFFDRYPEHILMDATYCLNNNRMPLYIILAVDGNNESIPVAFGLLAQETKCAVDAFMNCFVKHNSASNKIESFMTDKSFVEIEVLKKYFPRAKHELCLFHVLKSFRELVNSAHLPKSDLVDKCKKDLEAMAYAATEAKYMELYQSFCQTFKNFQIVEQFISRWHNCRESWSQYSRKTSYNLGDTTNNRVESMNAKLKMHITKYAALDDFYINLKVYLLNKFDKIYTTAFKDSTHRENTFTDISTDIKERVSRCCTHFVYSLMIRNICEGLGSKSVINNKDLISHTVKLPGHCLATTTIDSCDCSFHIMQNLPCSHIFALRHHLNIDIFNENLIARRWTKSYYLTAVNSCKSSPCTQSVKKVTKNLHPLTWESDRYSNSKSVCNSLLEVLKTSTDSQFEERVCILKKLVNEWSGNQKAVTETDVAHPNSNSNHLKIFSLSDSQESKSDIQDLAHIKDAIAKELPNSIKATSRRLTSVGRKRVLPKPSERLVKPIYRISDYMSKRSKSNHSDDPTTATWAFVNKEIALTKHHNDILSSDSLWLDSEIIYGACCLLRKEHAAIEGLQHTAMQTYRPPNFQPCLRPFVQICHVNNSHWNCIQGQVKDGTLLLNVYDSLYGTHSAISPEIISVASSLNRLYKGVTSIRIRVLDVCKQTNGNDCGVYAIAFAKLLCAGKDPCLVQFNQEQMRLHLKSALEKGSLHEFPVKSLREGIATPIEATFKKVFCFCRQAGNLEDTLTCLTCHEIFHINCYNQRFPLMTVVDNHNFICNRCK